MLTQYFVHDHDCSRQGQVVEVRPDVYMGTYFPRTPVCIEQGAELTLLRTEDTT